MKVKETLSRLMEATKRKPMYIRSDNCPEFNNKKLRQWLLGQGIESLYPSLAHRGKTAMWKALTPVSE